MIPMKIPSMKVFSSSTQIILPKANAIHMTPKASQPWSNSIPRGEDVPFLRACFPSALSIIWYVKRQIPQISREMGASLLLMGVCTMMAMAAIIWRRVPRRVRRLGAIRRGIILSMASAMGLQRYL